MLIERLRTSVSHALSQVVKPDLNETKIESRSQVAVLDFFSAVGFSNPTAIIKKNRLDLSSRVFLMLISFKIISIQTDLQIWGHPKVNSPLMFSRMQ